MLLANLGNSHLEHGLVILDSNIVNPIVIALSNNKAAANLFPHALIEGLTCNNQRKLIWQIGACESYMQRKMEPKNQLLIYCDSIFTQLGKMTSQEFQQMLEYPKKRKNLLIGDTPAQEYTKIYLNHLSIYGAMLKLLTLNKKNDYSWNEYINWISSTLQDTNYECLIFARLFLANLHNFQFDRITHYSGHKTGEKIAKCAWNVAWDILLISQFAQSEKRCLLFTQDIGLIDYYQYRTKQIEQHRLQFNFPRSSQQIDSDHLREEVKSQESKLGVPIHFDAQLPFLGGVRLPNEAG